MAHRIQGLSASEDTRRPHTRTIIARLSRQSDRNTVLRNSWKLKQTGLWINEDLSDETVKIRKQQQPQLKAARDAGKKAYFRGTKLIITDKPSNSSMNSFATPPPIRQKQPTNVFSPSLLNASQRSSSQTEPTVPTLLGSKPKESKKSRPQSKTPVA